MGDWLGFDFNKLALVRRGDPLVKARLYVLPGTSFHVLDSLLNGESLALDPAPEQTGGNANFNLSVVRQEKTGKILAGCIEVVVTTRDGESLIKGYLASSGIVSNEEVVALVAVEGDGVIYRNEDHADLFHEIQAARQVQIKPVRRFHVIEGGRQP